MTDLYPRPQHLELQDGEYRHEGPVRVRGVGEAGAELAATVVTLLTGRGLGVVELATDGPAQINVAILDGGGRGLLEACSLAPRAEVERPGGYLLSVTADGPLVVGFDAAGAFYGVQTMLQLLPADARGLCLQQLQVQDWPYKPVRGVHLYMPGREQIPFFRQLITWLASLKYNTLYLEVGGGMQYERHPEINEAWVEFCRAAAAFPGGQRGLQDSQPWVKDSTHTELGQGSFLSKAEVADLVAWARAHHIEVIPEVQTLSHAYYLCLAHPEIAERSDDPFPDTYCPSNPRTYEILFDLLDEVIEVFAPRLVHIGLDEIINLGHCPLCKDKSGAELLATNINRVHEHLAARGIRIGMWGDKLLPLATGGRFGGGLAMDGSNSYWGRANRIPATYEAMSMIPRDIEITNWYWKIDPEASRVFVREGFEVVLGNFGGNFSAQRFSRWQEDGADEGILGAEVSTWCEVTDFAFGYNGCFFNMIFAAQMLWWSHYRDLDREWVTAAVARQTRQLRQLLRGRVEDEGAASQAVDLPPRGPVALPTASSAPAVDTAHAALEIPLTGTLRGLRFVHGCGTDHTRRATWLLSDPGAYPDADLLGVYRVRYADGEKVEIPIYYGSHVARWDVPYGETVDAVPFHADPVARGHDGAGRRVTEYGCRWVNPRPDVEVTALALEYRGDAAGVLWLSSLERF